MRDIVFPRDNEKEFIKMAEKLGYTKLVFVYDSQKNFFEGKTKIKVENGLISSTSKVESAKNKTDFVLVKSSDKNRSVIEQKRPTAIFDLETSPKFDAIHQRASGLNHVLTRLMVRNGVGVAFSFKTLLDASSFKRSILMGRVKQNIQLCRKEDVDMMIGSFASSPEEMRNPDDIIALYVTLGMHPSEAKTAFRN
jgi:RNase P/RNase MRP subunit p30